MIKGIVFDKDGTLISYEKCWVERTVAATERLLSRHGAISIMDNIMKRLGVLSDGGIDISGALCHGTYADISKLYAAEMSTIGVKITWEELLPELKSDFYYFKHLAKSEPQCDGICELLSSLRGRGSRLGLVTSDDIEGVKATLSPLGVIPLFDAVLCSDGIHPTKPDPYYMLEFCRLTALSPTEVLMVGDTLADMEFGKNAGAYTLGVGKSEKNREILAAAADFLAPDISHIPEILRKII